jgi:hypothetical protein
MAGISKAELWAELDATDEAFVRRKYATGGYGPAKQRLVKEWLAQKDAARISEKAAADSRAAGRSAFWHSVTAYASLLAAFAAVAALFIR